MGLTMLLGCELVLEEHLRLGIASLAMQSLHGNVIMRPGHILVYSCCTGVIWRRDRCQQGEIYQEGPTILL